MLLSVLIFYLKTLKDFREFEVAVGLEHSIDAPLKRNPFAIPLVAIFLVAFVALFVLLSLGIITLNPTALSKKMIAIIVIATALYFCYLYFFCHLNSDEKRNLIMLVILYLAAAFFWSAFEQKPTSFNLFAQDFTERTFFGYEIPAAWSQSLNPLFIIAFAPIMSALWIFLARKNREISSLAKFTLGIIGAGVGFTIMIFAAKAALATGDKVSSLWLVSSIWFLTMGELCLSPVGLSIMTKLAPAIIRNQIMGLWFVSSALGNFIAGLIGGGVRADNITELPNLFMQCAFVLFGVAIALFVIKIFVGKYSQSKDGQK